jgi:hypothetical protein
MAIITSCRGITSNEYICADEDTDNNKITYKINNINNPSITNDLNNENIDIDDESISLNEYSSNHYLMADERAHCSEKWQDWFCIPNYHNNNRVTKYPDTEMMSIGTCYKPCPGVYTVGTINKCYINIQENDLIYNPLAIIAMLGTNFKTKENTNHMKESICIRGSYLNDLYRVNNNDNFIKEKYITLIQNRNIIIPAFDIQTGRIYRPSPFYITRRMIFKTKEEKKLAQEREKREGIEAKKIKEEDDLKEKKLKEEDDKRRRSAMNLAEIWDRGDTQQEDFLLKIIDVFIKKGIEISTIKEIDNNIENTISEFIKIYKIDKNNIGDETNLLNKIKYYSFNIDYLDKLYGNDKNNKPKFPNIIAYAFNIMRLVYYDNNGKLLNDDIVNENIYKLLDANIYANISGIDYTQRNKIALIFKYACYNCFNVNHLLFNEYLDNIWDDNVIMRLELKKDTNIYTTYKFIDYFKPNILTTNLQKIKLPENLKSTISYYNNLIFYDHTFLSEYSENTKYFIQLLIIFATVFCIILFICFLYFVCMYIHNMWGGETAIIYAVTDYINYVHLFYKWITFSLIKIMCSFYFYICRLGKFRFNIFPIFINILNICILIYLIIYLFIAIIELFSIDYITILTNMKSKNYSDVYFSIFFYLFSIYITLIYIYSAYLIRYSKTSSEYDIIGNYDADETLATNYVTNILLSEYASNMISNYTSIYTNNELRKATELDNGDFDREYDKYEKFNLESNTAAPPAARAPSVRPSTDYVPPAPPTAPPTVHYGYA